MRVRLQNRLLLFLDCRDRTGKGNDSSWYIILVRKVTPIISQSQEPHFQHILTFPTAVAKTGIFG